MVMGFENKAVQNSGLTFILESDSRKKELAVKVVENIHKPLDKWAVAAILESMGLRDTDVRAEFGTDSIFHLAEEIYDICQRDEEIVDMLNKRERAREEVENPVKGFFKYYSRGLSFMFPFLGQIILLGLFRYSLWAYIEFTEAEATIVALGTILSFIMSGGFVQAASRDSLYYLKAKEYRLAKKSYLQMFRFQLLAVVSVALALLLLNLLFPFFKMKMIVTSLLYFILLSELWFALTILYLIKHYLAVVLVTMIGILPVWAVMNFTKLGMFNAHFAGLIFANILSWVYALLWFRRKIRGQQHKNPVKLPHRSIVAYVSSPYFIYGMMYFTFLFVDRIVSWSTVETNVPAMLIWFRTPYELGMDWALLSLLITIALLEFTIERFSSTLIPIQDNLRIFELGNFIEIYKRFYRRQFVLLIIMGMASVAVTYYGVLYLKRFDYITEVKDFFSNKVTFMSFYVASGGYFFMAIGLLNGLFFLTLSRLHFAIKAIGISIFVNLITGILLSRWFGYEFGVFGLLAGGVTYALVSSKYANNFFRQLDYYYYSAY